MAKDKKKRGGSNLSAGYVSSPKRTRLKVRTYERLAMLAHLMHHVFIDVKWVAEEYLARCKSGAWKQSSEEDFLKCWNLERVIDAELVGAPEPEELTMEDLINEMESGVSDAD